MNAQRVVTMRVANMVPDMEYDLQQSQQSLAQALQQVTTGLRVNQPSDDPCGRGQHDDLSRIFGRRRPVHRKHQLCDLLRCRQPTASFSAIVTSLNTAVTLGTSGASSTASTANKQAIATQLRVS